MLNELALAFPYKDINGRLLRNIFMGLPSRKDYPDYYQVIMEPIDMTMIEAKIKADKVCIHNSFLILESCCFC